jgi:methanethiol S-methyltransferase
MNHDSTPAYGLWTVAFINAGVFILFAFSFFKPRTRRDWRTFSSFSAFIVALFVEMYGFPLTIYLLSGWLAKRFPGVDLLSHDAGHLWYALFGLKGDPHWNPIHVASSVLIGGGFVLLAGAWRVLYVAQSEGRLATKGPYRWLRHPQYAGFILIMLGFLVQWPTILTLAMFPVLVVAYVRLAHREEREVAAAFGEQWRAYAAITPRWFPRLGRHWTTPPTEVRT